MLTFLSKCCDECFSPSSDKIYENTVNVGRAFTEAIKSTGIKRVVMLSSIGVDFSEGTGPITGLHHIEELYKTLENSFVTFLRARYFYTNYYNGIPLFNNGLFKI